MNDEEFDAMTDEEFEAWTLAQPGLIEALDRARESLDRGEGQIVRRREVRPRD